MLDMMDGDMQRLYISSMLGSQELFSSVNHMVKPSYFDPDLVGAVTFLQDYFQRHRGIPSPEVFKASTKLTIDPAPAVIRSDLEFLQEQIASFCQISAVIAAVSAAPELIQTRDFAKLVNQVKEASQVGLKEDLGIDYFADPMARLEQAEIDEVLIPTGWDEVDELIDGGIGRQELIMFLAPSGGGKSVGMLNMGLNLLERGLHGVYYSFEMADGKVAKRTDQMISKIAGKDIMNNKEQVVEAILEFGKKSGRLFVKRMKEGVTNANHLIAHLKQLEATHGFRPDFIIADYMDIMASVQKVSNDNMFLKDKYVAEELRAIGLDYNCIVISASQLGKHVTEAINDGKSLHQGDVQGGSSKTNTADLMIGMVKTEMMDSAGEYRFEFIKSRNSGAVGKSCTLSWDRKSLRISSLGKLAINKKPKGLTLAGVVPGKQRSNVLDM